MMIPPNELARRAASYLLKESPNIAVRESYNEDEVDIFRATHLHWDKEPNHKLGAYETHAGMTQGASSANELFKHFKESLNALLFRIDEKLDGTPWEPVYLPSAIVLNEDKTVNTEESVAPAGASGCVIGRGGFPLRVFQYYSSLCDYSPRPDRDLSGQFNMNANGGPVMRNDGCTITFIEVGLIKPPVKTEAAS